MNATIKSIFIVVILAGCGSGSGPRDYENPSDPDFHPASHGPKDVAENSNDEKLNGVLDRTTISEKSAIEEKPTCLLGCALDETVAFNFSTSYDITPTKCSAVKQLRIVPKKDDYTVIINGTCNDQVGIFAYKWSPATGIIAGDIAKISHCDQSYSDISHLEVVEGGGSIAYNYLCSTGTTSFSPRFGIFDVGLFSVKGDMGISPLPNYIIPPILPGSKYLKILRYLFVCSCTE
jgi:hypothetical protein